MEGVTYCRLNLLCSKKAMLQKTGPTTSTVNMKHFRTNLIIEGVLTRDLTASDVRDFYNADQIF